MAASVKTLHADGVDGEVNPLHIWGDIIAVPFRVTLTGNYAAGGDALLLSNLLKRTGKGAVLFVMVPSGLKGYLIEYDYGTDKLVIRQGDNANAAAAPGTELPVAAYPAALTGAVIRGLLIGR